MTDRIAYLTTEAPDYYEAQPSRFDDVVLDGELGAIAEVLRAADADCDNIPAEAKAWLDEGFDAYAVADWLAAGVTSAREAADLDDLGVEPVAVPVEVAA